MMTSIDPRLFRDVLGRFATGVTVVTVRAPHDTAGEPAALRASPDETIAPATVHGMTVNAFMSVSLDPPLVAIGIDRKAKALAALLTTDRFGISVLEESQRGLSDQFAGRPVPQQHDPFVSLDGFPVVTGALAQIVCRRWRTMEAGDHTLFVGEVEALRHDTGDPLLYFGGRYRALLDPGSVG